MKSKIVIFLLATFILFSCSDLEEEPVGLLSPEGFVILQMMFKPLLMVLLELWRMKRIGDVSFHYL